MEKIVLEIHEGVVEAFQKIKGTKNGGVEVVIPEGSVLFENILNLKLLKKEAETLNKPLVFSTTDEAGLALLDILEGGNGEVSADFISREVSFDSVTKSQKKGRRIVKPPLPKFSFAFLKNIRLPKLAIRGKAPFVVVGVVVFGLLAYGAYQLWWKVPKAQVNVVVGSQPLIKSVEVQVRPGEDNNVEDRILAGVIIENILTEEMSKQTTGEKVVGEKAEGRIKIVNRTTVDKEFNDGEELYATNDDDLTYQLKDDVIVLGATLQDPLDINSPIIPGSAEVDVVATDIGSDFNIDQGDDLEFEDYPSSDYVAEVAEDVDGGSSDIVSVVTQLDLDTLSEDLFAQIGGKGEGAVRDLLGFGQVLINGSVVSVLATEEFSAELDEEVDEVTLSQTVIFQGLSYNEGDLEEILDDLLKEFIPSGFELSSEERDTNVEILGNTDASVLNLSQADLQVTIKSYVIPEIDEDKLKEDLVGTSISRAEEILGKVRNVNNYEIQVEPNIPFFKKLPGNIDNITLKVTRE